MCCQSNVYTYLQHYFVDTPVMCSAGGENCACPANAALARPPRPNGGARRDLLHLIKTAEQR